MASMMKGPKQGAAPVIKQQKFKMPDLPKPPDPIPVPTQMDLENERKIALQRLEDRDGRESTKTTDGGRGAYSRTTLG